MSQLAPRNTPLTRVRSRRALVLGALIAALAAVALAFALAGSSENTVSVTDRAQPTVRADGGPEESAVAAAVWSRPTERPRPAARPDESRIAASIRPADPFSRRPDEARIAASISPR